MKCEELYKAQDGDEDDGTISRFDNDSFISA